MQLLRLLDSIHEHVKEYNGRPCTFLGVKSPFFSSSFLPTAKQGLIADLEDSFKGNYSIQSTLPSYLRAPPGRFYIPLSEILGRLWLWGSELFWKFTCNGATGCFNGLRSIFSLLLERESVPGMERKISSRFIFDVYFTNSPKLFNLHSNFDTGIFPSILQKKKLSLKRGYSVLLKSYSKY